MKPFIVIALFLFSFTVGATTLPSFEKQALIDLYHATDGDNWTESWDLTTPVETWKGVTIINDKVVALKLTNNNLQGELPASIGDLTHLKILNLHNNAIKGNIPASIGKLDKLIRLNISLNAFQGSIPEEISNLKSLEYLYIFSNDFTGFLPTNINKIPNLKRIRMYATNIKEDTTSTLAIVY